MSVFAIEKETHKRYSHCEEHSEAIANCYDCRWQSFNRECDVAISKAEVQSPGDSHASVSTGSE